jgi:peptidoglycan/LPS O-acetylase OafA/YrhL
MSDLNTATRRKNWNIVENLGAELAKSNRHLNIRFRPDIEGLRAVAVCLVVLYHAGVPFLHGGFIGVDIFFVLSGYLITSLLAKELDTSSGINLPRFYARRVRRLLPASSLVVVVVCLIQVVAASPIAQMEILKAALTTTLYGSNFYFAHIQSHYFSRDLAPSPLLHTWSLAVEEQIYFVWPIFLLVLTRAVRNVRIQVLVIAAITALSFIGCIWLTSANPIAAFYLSPPRAWEFSIGGMLALMPTHWLTGRESLSKWLGVAGLFALALCGVLIADSAKFPGYIAAIPVLATLAALQAGAGAPSSPAARWLNWRPLQYLGGISYSLYLWHWPVLIMAPEILHNDSAAFRAGCVALSVALAAMTHIAVENPVRFNSFLVSRSLLSLGIVALSMTIGVGGFAVWWAALNHSAQFRKFNQVRNDVPAFYATGCAADLIDASPKLCSFGETSRPESTMVLFGDSHAAQWFPALRAIADSRHWKLVTIVKSACSPMNIKILRNARDIEACERWRMLAIAEIDEIHPDIVIIATSSLYRQRDSASLIDAMDWEKGSRDTFLALASPGVAVRLLRDTPHADYDVPHCLAQLAWNGRATCPPLPRTKALSPDIYQAQLRAAANIDNVKIIDMSDAICGKDTCETEQGDIVKYRDSDHMTSSYMENLAGALQGHLLESLQ